MAKLIILDGPRGGDEIDLGTTVTLGRHSENAVSVPDEGVSKHHARIELRGERHHLVDLESLNGSYVNRRRVRSVALSHRDEVRLGSTRLLFVDPRQAREQALGLSISLQEEGADLDTETTAVFKLPELQEPDELGHFMEEFDKLHQAFRVGAELTGIVDEEELGAKVLAHLFEILPADRGVVFLTQEGSLELRQVAARNGRGEARPDLQVEVARALVRAASARKLATLVQDMAQDPRFSGEAETHGVKSGMAVPLLRRGQLVGAVYLDNVHRPLAFSTGDMDLVVGVGVHLAAALENARLFRDVEGERMARERVSRYLSPSLVDRVVQSGDGIDLGGEKADITVLFADLRGFTPLAEKMPPDEVVVMLNDFFELAVDLIFKYGGTLDKFIGDAVMAFWGVPVRRSIDPHLALLTAVKLSGELHCLNERRTKLGKPPLGLGVGLHTGPAVAGNLGTQRRMEYTVIGDTVNLASRIQDMAPRGQVLISEDTRAKMKNLVITSEHPDRKITGRAKPVTLHRVHGMYLQEKVAHELRKVRRMQVALRAHLAEDGERPPFGVLTDLSPVGVGVVFDDFLRHRFEAGAQVDLQLEPDQGFEACVLRGTVASVREVFERAGTVYLHVGLRLGDDGLPEPMRRLFFPEL